MNYLSTRELSELWNISISRVVRLAKTGRIPGAKLVGKSWMFPADSRKPDDRRKKDCVIDPEEQHFHFPLYFYTSLSETEVKNDFSEDELSLYQAEKLFYTGNFSEAVEICDRLNALCKDRIVRYGALYHLCIGNIYLRYYQKAFQHFHEICRLFSNEHQYARELEFLIHDLETYFTGNQFYLENFSIDFRHRFPSKMHGYLAVESAYADLMQGMVLKVPVNPIPYQLIYQEDYEQLGILTKIMLSLYISLILVNRQPENSKAYLLEACRMAESSNMTSAMAYLFHYYPEFFTSVLADELPQFLCSLESISDRISESFFGLLSYQDKNEFLRLLDPVDYQFVILASNGKTHKEIAAAMHLSVSSIAKKYAALYEKTGAHNKNELVQMCSDALNSY